jgi:transcriptional regulator GlxA family with amidase domain
MDKERGVNYQTLMANLIVAAVRNSYVSSVGAMIDAHARLAEIFAGGDPHDSAARLYTGLQLLTPEGRKLQLAGGRTLAADGGLGDAVEPVLVYLPNFQVEADELPRLAAREARLVRWLAEMAARGVVICASGAGAWPCAAAGLLDERRASIDARHAAAFRRAFPKVRIDPRQAMTTDEPVMTCAADAFEPDLVIRAIDRSLSPGAALWLALRRGGGEAAEVSSDPLVARAQMLIRERFTHEVRIDQLAAELSVSHQTLIRRFRQSLGRTPKAYVQEQRLIGAAASLRETRRSVAEIAAMLGYSDAPSFRAAFRAYAGMTPSDYRRAHGRRAEA